MREILSWKFNIDTARLELRLDEGILLSIDCAALENETANSSYQWPERDRQNYNDALAYAKLIFPAKPIPYLNDTTKKKTPLD